MATWNAYLGSLSMTLSPGAELQPYRMYAVSFKLQNGFTATTMSDVRISALLKGTCMQPLQGTLCAGERTLQNSTLEVCEPGFSVKSIGQNYPWPGCDGASNYIVVTLIPNVKIQHPAVMQLLHFLGPADAEVFQNVNVSTIVPGVRYAAENSTNVSFAWNDAGDKVLLPVWANYPLIAGEEYIFAFTVTNPILSQLEAPISISVIGPVFNISTMLDHDMTAIPIASRTFPGDAAALRILSPQFIIKMIGQNNPYPDFATNTLTVTLVPNIAMGTKSDNNTLIPSRITLSGLISTETSTTTLSITQTSPSTSILNSNATWSQQDGALVVSFKNLTKWRTSDEAIIFSFQIKNPGVCQSSPDVMVSAISEGTDCPSVIAAASMDKDNSSVPFEDCRACGSTGDHCEACEKCDEKCDDEDATPLKVHSPAFIVKKIQQSTTWPGAANKLNISFAANIDFTGDSALLISGFVGGIAPNGTLNLTEGGSLFDVVEWNDNDKVLYLDLASAGVSAGETKTFEFSLKNPLTAQRAPLITIWAINAGSCKKPVPKCTMDRPANANVRPLTVDSIAFVVRAIGQSSPFSRTINRITVTLATNFVLQRPTKVTVMGLMGSTIQSNLALTVVAGSLFENSAVWTQGTGTLVLSLKENAQSTPGQNYTVSVDLLNPPAAQNAPLVSIAASNIDAVLANSWPNDVLPSGHQLPMKVIRPRIVTAKIGQSSAQPGARNLVTVTLRMNAFIQSTSKGAFTIAGLMGARSRTGPIALQAPETCNGTSCMNVFKASPTGAPGTAFWRGEGKALTIEENTESAPQQSLVLYIADSIQANYDYVFSFDVQNANCNHNCSSVSIITNGLEFVPASCSDDISSFIVSPVPSLTAVVQDLSTPTSCVGIVHAPSFDIKTISECSTVNGDPNTLSVTISPNVDLKQGAVLSISGLTGTDTESTPDIQGPDSTLFSQVAWSRSKGELILTLRDVKGIAMGQVVAFSFSLKNQASPPRSAVRPTIGVESAEIIIGESVMSGLVLGAGDAPSLTVASISESSTVQRTYNTLMILINSNSRIPSGSTMTFSGLTGTSPMPTEMYAITGMHPYFFSSSFQWSEATGVLKLSVVSAIAPSAQKMFAFEVKNPSAGQTARTIQVSVNCPAGSPGCPAGGFNIPQTPMHGSVLSAATASRFTTRMIGPEKQIF